jgi:O-antigen/teichoic acid export membrane protein
VAAGLNLVLNAALIPLGGIQAAALITLGTEVVRTGFSLHFTREAGLPLPAALRMWKPALAALAMSAPVIALESRSLPLAVMAGVAAYGAVLTLLGGVRIRRGVPELSV